MRKLTFLALFITSTTFASTAIVTPQTIQQIETQIKTVQNSINPAIKAQITALEKSAAAQTQAINLAIKNLNKQLQQLNNNFKQQLDKQARTNQRNLKTLQARLNKRVSQLEAQVVTLSKQR